MKWLRRSFVIALAVGVAVTTGCGDDDDDGNGSNPLSSDDVDMGDLRMLLSDGDEEDGVDDILFLGLIDDGETKTGEIVDSDDAYIYEFSMESERSATITLDGDEDIFWILLKVLNDGDDFGFAAANDEDDDSPLDGYADRSQATLTIETGRYLLIIGSYDDNAHYRLQIEW